ncbi:MAG: hypothetical protein ACN4EP_09250 [Sediminibacterium sp.]
MRLTHPAYIKLVFGTYQKLRSTTELSPALKKPTLASIRKECLIVYKERPEKKDEATLRSFFGPAQENESFQDLIKDFPTERYKAFSNYLKGKAIKTEDKNVELLAWLIDFPHRPYRYGMEVILTEEEKAILNSDESLSENIELDNEEEKEDKNEEVLSKPHGNELEDIAISTNDAPELEVPISSGRTIRSGKKHVTFNRQWLVIGIPLVFTILSLGFYLLYNKGAECMYWTGDHYEKIDCDAALNNKVVFNKERWKNFRRITDLNTISEQSIGIVHYFGNKNREFYTSGGMHPVDNTRYLRVMTRYIWEKEFGSKDSLPKNNPTVDNKKSLDNKQ